VTVEIGGPEPIRILIAEYSEEWPRRFEVERARIAGALGDRALLIEHIGSTSVPGLAAKPIVDIALGVADVHDAGVHDALVDAGYVLRVEEPDHRMFRTPARDVHVHIYELGSPEIDKYLRFRDRLRTNADDRARYEARKRELAARGEWANMQDYADEKTGVVLDILGRDR
jgi:GrpB-like predicted nucleotidyltransferase (UPF0157 family)